MHHDVAVSWLARSLWYVLGPLLALPVVVALVQREPVLAVDILWRGAVLLGVVVLVVRGLMRAREVDADLRAAEVFGVGPCSTPRWPGARPGRGPRSRGTRTPAAAAPCSPTRRCRPG